MTNHTPAPYSAEALITDFDWEGISRLVRDADGTVTFAEHEPVTVRLSLRAADATGLDLTRPVTISQGEADRD